MSIKNNSLGGTDWGSAENVNSVDLNDTFDASAQNSPYNAPVGCVMAWLKNYSNTPALPIGWVECNGQTLSDTDSVYNTQVIPDLNGGNRFLRGNATSGGTGGSETHTHGFTSSTINTDGGVGVCSGNICSPSGEQAHGTTGAGESKPPYYEVVWIMRVK